MKVLMLLHDYLPRHPGGTEIAAHQLARALAARGHDVTAVFGERDLQRSEGARRAGSLDGVRTLELVHQREYGDVRASWEEPRARERFARVLAELAPDVVHVHHLATWGPGCLAVARDAGAALAMTLHDEHPLCDGSRRVRADGAICTPSDADPCGDCLRRHPFARDVWGPEAGAPGEALRRRAMAERRAAFRAGLARVQRFLAPSRHALERARAGGLVPPDRVDLDPTGTPGPRRPPRAGDAGRPLRVGYVGGLYPDKGVHVAVEAWRSIDAREAELAIHGETSWFPEYVARLEGAARGRAVRLAGPFPPDEVDRVLSGLDLLIAPSLWPENRPLVVLEAYRNGLAVVASDVGGLPELVVPGRSGVLVPAGDAAALAGAVRRLAADRDELLRLASGRPALPTPEEQAERVERVYGACLARRAE